MQRFVFIVFLFLVSFPLFSQEIRVARGKGGEFPKKHQGREEGNGIYFGMADLPPGRIMTLNRPGSMLHRTSMDKKDEKRGNRTAQIVIVKQIPSRGRLRSSEVVLSPRGADFFGVKSEMFLVTDNSSVRWADNIPPVNPVVPKNYSKDRFNNSDVDNSRWVDDSELKYVLEPADKRPPKKEVELEDVVDELEDNQKTHNPSHRINVDVNVGVSNNGLSNEIIPPRDDYNKPESGVPDNLDFQLNSKMVSSMPPGTYIQLGYYAKRDSLLNMLRQVGSKYNVKILPENNGSGKNYRFFIGSFANEDEISLARQDLYNLGLTDFFVVKH